MAQHNNINKFDPDAEAELGKIVDEIIIKFEKSGKKHRLRVGRALLYALAAYFTLWLQELFDFSFIGMATVIFLLALGNKTRLIAEIALGLILLSAFIPPSVPPTPL